MSLPVIDSARYRWILVVGYTLYSSNPILINHHDVCHRNNYIFYRITLKSVSGRKKSAVRTNKYLETRCITQLYCISTDKDDASRDSRHAKRKKTISKDILNIIFLCTRRVCIMFTSTRGASDRWTLWYIYSKYKSCIYSIYRVLVSDSHMRMRWF